LKFWYDFVFYEAPRAVHRRTYRAVHEIEELASQIRGTFCLSYNMENSDRPRAGRRNRTEGVQERVEQINLAIPGQITSANPEQVPAAARQLHRDHRVHHIPDEPPVLL